MPNALLILPLLLYAWSALFAFRYVFRSGYNDFTKGGDKFKPGDFAFVALVSLAFALVGPLVVFYDWNKGALATSRVGSALTEGTHRLGARLAGEGRTEKIVRLERERNLRTTEIDRLERELEIGPYA